MVTYPPIRPLKGLDFSLPSPTLDPAAATFISNWRFSKGLLSSRPGYSIIGSALGQPVVGVGEFLKTDGTRIAICFTDNGPNTGNLWQWDVGTSAWVIVPYTGVVSNSLDGFSTTQISMAVAEGNNLVFANNANELMVWTGGATFGVLTTDITTTVSKYVTSFADRVIIGNLTSYPTRIKWSSTVITVWSGTGYGSNDLDQTPDAITGLGRLLNQLVIYKEENIWMGQRTGDANNPFYFTNVISGQGLILPFTLIDLGWAHFVIGYDDLYMFDGQSLHAIGGKIRREFFNALNLSVPGVACGTYINESKEILIFIPEGTSIVNTACWVFNLENQEWSKYSLYDTVSCVGQSFYTTGEYLTWDQEVGSWNEASDTWAGAGITKSQERIGTSSGKIMGFSNSTYNDNGSAINYVWESKDFDFEVPTRMKRVGRILLGYISSTGVDLTLGISNDEGVSWVNSTLTLGGSGIAIKKKYFDFSSVGQKVRLRISFNGTTEECKIAELSIQYGDGGDYYGD